MDVSCASALRDRAAVGRPRRISAQFRAGRFVLRNYGSCVGLILALTLINCFWRLATNVVSDSDEARYGVAAGEMLRRHALLVPTYGGQTEYWNLKPPLGYWLQELTFRVFGPSIFAMRLPAALCALAVVALTMSACRRWFGRRPAILAGLILATCFGFFSHHGARSGDLDSPLTLILLVAVLQIPGLTRSAASRMVWAAMIALGFLLKSFAVLPFVVITLAYLAWSAEWRSIRARDWWPALALLAAIIVGWGLARSWTDGSLYYVARMVREDLFSRALQQIDSNTSAPWGYLEVLLDRFAPWPLILLGAMLLRRRTGLPPSLQTRLLLLWTLVPLAMFSAAQTKHHWYLDPTYPGWSMLAALCSMQLLAVSARRGLALFGALLCLSLLFCEARVLLRIGRTDRRPANQGFLLSLRNHTLVPANALIESKFPLSHSERFILQVVDDYRVSEPGLPTVADATQGAGGPRMLLFRRRQGFLMSDLYRPTAGAHAQLVAESTDYVLWRAAAD